MRTPFVGRQSLLSTLTAALDAAARGRGSAHVLLGDGGIGKTRVAEAVTALAADRDFTRLVGRAYPVEQGVPYALLADAVLPTLRAMPTTMVEVLTRGGVADLVTLFPGWRPDGVHPLQGDSGVVKARMYDTFATFLQRMAARGPVLLVADNLHWADPSSLELLHFVARQVATQRVVLVGTWNSAWSESAVPLSRWEQSLRSLGVLTTHDLAPLTATECRVLVARHCGVDETRTEEAATWLHERSGGNPFFLEELITALRAQGRLQGDGTGWTDWSTVPRALPRSIRDALVLRIAALDTSAHAVATLAAVVGTEVPHALLEALAALPGESLMEALTALRRERILLEQASEHGLTYAFSHPLLREVLLDALPAVRRQATHARIATILASAADAGVAHHALLAVHYLLADDPQQHRPAAHALLAAGRSALQRSAAREAVEFLEGAVVRAVAVPDDVLVADCRDAAARAQVQRGAHAQALQHWEAVRVFAAGRGDAARLAALDRRMSAALARGGDLPGALDVQARGLAVAIAAGDDRAVTELRLARSALLLDVGRGSEAEHEARDALTVALRTGEPRLLTRVHHALQLIAIYRGPRVAAEAHATQARRYALDAHDDGALWNAAWGMAVHAGLTGDSAGTAQHLAEAWILAERTRSPLQRLWTAEVEIEYRSGIGDWDAALQVADRAIREARDLSQTALLPRLLVWSALVRLGRGEFAPARVHIDEAWAMARVDHATGTDPVTVHVVIPAHVGRAAWHLAHAEYASALQTAEAGLAVADRTGYIAWAVHRLMPIAAEASLWLRDWDRAARYGARLRESGDRLGHPLALAWGDACAALSRMLQGDKAGAIAQLHAAADALDAIPFVEHGARLRRKLADAYHDSGDRERAIQELRRVHEVFDRLGAGPALMETRGKLRQLGVRPPVRRATPAGGATLTARELEIVHLVAARCSNKAIADRVDISPRTVSTHLSNIFAKLSVSSRGELTDMVRQGHLGPLGAGVSD